MIRSFLQSTPHIGDRAHIDATALVMGNVTLGDDCFILPMAVLRGDVNRIVIGDRTNIQDNSVCHVNHEGSPYAAGSELLIGDDVTVGHRVILHGCTVQSRCLIGMGSIIMDGAVIKSDAIIAAGSVIPRGKIIDGGYLWMGAPVRQIRCLTDEEKASIVYSAQHYVALKDKHRLGALES